MKLTFPAPGSGGQTLLGDRGLLLATPHGLSKDPCAQQPPPPPPRDRRLPPLHGTPQPPPDPTVRAHAPAGPCALANGWEVTPGDPLAGLRGGARGAAGMGERSSR